MFVPGTLMPERPRTCDGLKTLMTKRMFHLPCLASVIGALHTYIFPRFDLLGRRLYSSRPVYTCTETHAWTHIHNLIQRYHMCICRSTHEHTQTQHSTFFTHECGLPTWPWPMTLTCGDCSEKAWSDGRLRASATMISRKPSTGRSAGRLVHCHVPALVCVCVWMTLIWDSVHTVHTMCACV